MNLHGATEIPKCLDLEVDCPDMPKLQRPLSSQVGDFLLVRPPPKLSSFLAANITDEVPSLPLEINPDINPCFETLSEGQRNTHVVPTVLRRSCKYGIDCKDHSVGHRKAFAHPGEADYIIYVRGWLLAKTSQAGGNADNVEITEGFGKPSFFEKGLSFVHFRSPGRAGKWERQYFMLGPDGLVYWPPNIDASRGPPPTSAGFFAFTELDEVTVQNGELALKFKSRSTAGIATTGPASIALREIPNADTNSISLSVFEKAVRSAMMAKLGTLLPNGWNLDAVLREKQYTGRFVNKEPPSGIITSVIQRLLDHTFICLETRDRLLIGNEVPLRLEVLSVLKVENGPAWFAYDKARNLILNRIVEPFTPRVMTSTLSDSIDELGKLIPCVNEHWLFHGTTVLGAQGISDGEFRMDLVGSHRGTLYGNGVYLAESSTKADEYAEADDEGLCRMLLCRAALGNVLTNADRYPNKADLERCCADSKFDSVCGDRNAARGTFREFVFYKNSQVYPAYIVHYRRVQEAELLHKMREPLKDPEPALQYVAHVARLIEAHPNPDVVYRIKLLLGIHSGNSIPKLIECLKDKRPGVRRHAADTLGRLSSFPQQCHESVKLAITVRAVPQLTCCLKDSDLVVRLAAAMALEKINVWSSS